MQVPTRLGPERLDVTIVASCFTAKQHLASRGSGLIEGHRRIRRRNGKLVKLQGCEFGSNEIAVRANVGQVRKAVRSCNGELLSVVQAGVEEPARAVHLEVGHERVPVRHRAPPRPGMEIYSSQAKSGRNQRGSGYIRACNHAVADLPGVKCLAVQKQLGIEFSRSPTVEHLPHGGLIDSQKVGYRVEIGRERYDPSYIQITVRPAIQTVTDATGAGVGRDLACTESRKRIVDRRVTERALYAERLQCAGRIKNSGNAEHRVQFEERKRYRRVVEIDLPLQEPLQQAGRQRIGVHFQANSESGLRTHSGAHSSEPSAFDGQVKFERVAPEGLIAEGVKTERLLSLLDLSDRIVDNRIRARALRVNRSRANDRKKSGDHQNCARHDGRYAKFCK